MDRDPTRTDGAAFDRALGRAWRDDAPWRVLTRLTELDDRLGGHPGERRAADVVAGAFEEAGAREVTRQPFEMTRWTRGRTDLTLRVPGRGVERSFEALALPYSPADDLRAPLVDVGHGTPADFEDRDVEGAVVLSSTETPRGFGRYLHRMERVGAAAEAGAVGFVFANHVPGQLPPTGSLRFGAPASIPGVGVSHETGEWLREYAADGREDDGGNGNGGGDGTGNGRDAAPELALRVDAATDPGESRNVSALLGPDTDEEVLVCAHYDAHDVGEGALDNGCGVATLVGVTRILADVEDALSRRVRVAGVGCEELGLLGAEALADDLDRVRAVVNLDGVGRYRRLRALSHASEPMAAVAERVADRLDHPVSVEERPHPYSDHWPFVRGGVPALQFHSRQPDRDPRWQRGWTHTRADTREKADARTIREHAMVVALVVAELTDADPGRVDEDRLREAFEETGAEPGMRAAGVWPEGWD